MVSTRILIEIAPWRNLFRSNICCMRLTETWVFFVVANLGLKSKSWKGGRRKKINHKITKLETTELDND